MLNYHQQMVISERTASAVMRYTARRTVMRYKKDASGHEHKEKGPGGGQFTSGGGGSATAAESSGRRLMSGDAIKSLTGLGSKAKIADASEHLKKHGITLHGVAPYDLKNKQAQYWVSGGESADTRKPTVPGQQMGLFDKAPGGQRSLFNMVAPSAKSSPKTNAKPPLSQLEQIADEQQKQRAFPLPGQKALPNTTEGMIKDQQSQPTTPPPPGKTYNPDPADGKAARVGVAGDVVPPPPKMIPRLPNLNPEERAIEHKFATMFESDPDGMAGQMIEAMKNGMGDGPNIFATDEAKGLLSDWKGTKVTGPDGKSDLSPETKAFRSKYNTALHQTANAVAKRAFVKYLDDVVAKLPEDQRQVLVTAGGVAAGKGYAIANVGAVNEISKLAAATWDSAGEQNSTELPWVADECKKRGIKMTAVYVHSNPQETWENPARGVIERAGKKGRMVDARVFADSYTHGARNFHAFHQKYANDPAIRSVVLDNTQKSPAMLQSVPSQMLTMDPDALYARCLTALEAPNVPEPVKQGGSAGTRIWGAPKASPAA